MRLTTIKEALALDFGEKVPSLRGKIKAVYDQSKGTNEHGEWTLQSVVLIDPADPKAELRVKIFNGAEMSKAVKGKWMLLASTQGKDGKGIVGLTLLQDVYKWKQGQPEKRQLEVKGDKAEIVIGDEAAPGAERAATTDQAAQGESKAPEPAKASQAPAQAQAGGKSDDKATAQKHVVDGARAIVDCKRFLGSRVNGMRLVIKGALKIKEDLKAAGEPLTPEHFQSLCASLFISADRAGQFDALPYDDLGKYVADKSK